MDYKELVEHLERRGLSNPSSYGHHSGLYEQAASAITDLLARVEELEAENATLRKMQPVQLDDAGARALELAAEVSELKQKLEAAEARAEKAERDANEKEASNEKTP